MNNATAIVRALVTYTVCVPLAIVIGYLLAKPLGYSTMAIFGILILVLAFPLVVRWHYPLFLLSWSMPTILIFLKGQPNLWLGMAAITLTISILERASSRESQFVVVPRVIWPLVALVFVVIATANLTGGFGLRSFGSDVYGGKKYIFLLAAIISYFALTTRPISHKQANLFVGLFFLGGFPSFIGDLYPVAPSWMEFVFWFFPPTRYEGLFEFELGVTRLGGCGATGVAVYCFMMAIYGIRGIFLSGRPIRLLMFLVFTSLIFLGGFRSTLLFVAATFILQFFLEGMHKTKLLPAFGLLGVLVISLTVPFASKLPFTFQRTLAIVPGLELDARARLDAEGSSSWRRNMWTALMPQVSRYFFIGKGYAISQEDYQNMGWDTAFRSVDASQQGLALSGDYHNGPLSVIIPFGIWGVIAFFWFLVAALKVVYRNYRYGDPELRTINTFFFVNFVVAIVMFMSVVGALSGDIARFIGIVGLSICLNRGVAQVPREKPAEAAAPAPGLLRQPRPSFQR